MSRRLLLPVICPGAMLAKEFQYLKLQMTDKQSYIHLIDLFFRLLLDISSTASAVGKRNYSCAIAEISVD